MAKKEKLFITGLYGCSCHPFSTWEECKKCHNQKLKVKQRVKHRCLGKVGNICTVYKPPGNYYLVNWEPQKYASDRCLEHASGLEIIEQ